MKGIIACIVITVIVWFASAINPESSHFYDCLTMEPSIPNTAYEVKPSPFEIIVKQGTYRGGQTIDVIVTSTRPTKKLTSFFLQARRVDEKHAEPIGSWRSLDPDLTTPICKEFNSHGLMSNFDKPLKNITLYWQAPNPSEGHVEIVGTFIDEDNKFWLQEQSSVIRDPQASSIPFKSIFQPSPPIEPVHTDVCGKEKGCYRYPAGCWEKYCEYLFTWKDSQDEVEFEISVLQDGNHGRWAAVALSHDTYMGNDVVMECVQDEQTGKVEVFMSVTSERPKDVKRLANDKHNIDYQEGSYLFDRLRCRFTRRKSYPPATEEISFPLVSQDGYHLLMAKGIAHNMEIRRHEITVSRYPIASPVKVSLQGLSDIGGKARYPLVKAHACLMLLAWIFFGCIGLLMVKFYKPMWPNSDWYGEKYWFQVHRACLVSVVILVFIAFILIFIECDGYSQHPDLPGRAHPILGIIVFVCVLINPILALLRPSEENKCRPVFNWFHFFFGLVANILAVVNIFIGMGFGKANIPYWATWIVMLFFLFNLIIEVMLEVHMCWTHKKNKERMKKWEAMKKEYPKQYHPKPDPAGHRFKRNVLFTHIIVTSIVTIILVITFAVC